MKRCALLSVISALLILLPAVAQAQLNIVGHYTSTTNTSFDIGTFTKDKDKVAIIGIARKVSITFGKDDWGSFVAMWRKAERTRSGSFQFIGPHKESGASYNSLLTVAAGPGVQFTINDGHFFVRSATR